MRPPRRAGFGAIELIVIVAIVAVLFGFGLVAYSKVRMTAKRIESSNNLRQMGIAIISSETTNGQLPAQNDENGFSAYVRILDELELGNVSTQLDLTKPMTDKANANVRKMKIKLFLSPNDPLQPVGDFGGTNYLFCAGSKPGLKDNDGAFAPGKKITLDEISKIRGTSFTVMIGETLRGDGSDKAVGVQRQHVALKKDALKEIKDETGVDDFKDGKNIAGNRGGCWLDGRFLQTCFTGTRGLDDARPDVDCDGAGGLSALRSLNGHVPVVFADGHVQMIGGKADVKIWKAITSIKNTDNVKIPE